MLERETLYYRIEPLVNRLVRRYAVDLEERNELAGELHRRFQELLASYDSRCGVPLYPYLTRALTSFAEQFAQPGRPHGDSLPDMITRQDAPRAVPVRLPSESELAASHLQPLAALIAQLPLPQRRLLIWRYYEMRSPSAIATTLRVRPEVAHRLLRRALYSLRRRLRTPEHKLVRR